jgi:hypothetical protein
LKRVPVVAAVLAAQFFVTARARAADEPKDLGDRIVDYCKDHKGKRVGNGQCTSFVMAALLASGAKPHGWGDDRREPPKRGEFNWGELFYTVQRNGGSEDFKWTGKFEDIRPGDIVQFYNVELAGSTESAAYTLQARHHSAIVYRVDQQNGLLKIFHQNYNGNQTVVLNQLRMADLQQGRFSIYHPLPATRRRADYRKPRAAEAPDE